MPREKQYNYYKYKKYKHKCKLVDHSAGKLFSNNYTFHLHDTNRNLIGKFSLDKYKNCWDEGIFYQSILNHVYNLTENLYRHKSHNLGFPILQLYNKYEKYLSDYLSVAVTGHNLKGWPQNYRESIVNLKKMLEPSYFSHDVEIQVDLSDITRYFNEQQKKLDDKAKEQQKERELNKKIAEKYHNFNLEHTNYKKPDPVFKVRDNVFVVSGDFIGPIKEKNPDGSYNVEYQEGDYSDSDRGEIIKNIPKYEITTLKDREDLINFFGHILLGCQIDGSPIKKEQVPVLAKKIFSTISGEDFWAHHKNGNKSPISISSLKKLAYVIKHYSELEIYELLDETQGKRPTLIEKILSDFPEIDDDYNTGLFVENFQTLI